jgi:single stranded DNA-binding protein
MRSVNRLTILGNVGNDPEVRSTTGGTRVATLSVATTEQWGQGDERQEKTEWHRVVLWAGLADIAEKYIKKGDRVYVEGRVEYRQWQDKEGATRYTTEVVAKEVVMVGSAARRNANGPHPAERDDMDHDDGHPSESAGDFFDRKAAEGRGKASTAKKSTAKKSTGKRTTRR